ncbi:MAG: 50S ribosomal protein L4 [Candidatus Omnitrophica bacterium 4484_70.2]|nr:MAG: 50S ribosomal protein L4 [Candidatus Omnitrophica bacterium 4484_70.2]
MKLKVWNQEGKIVGEIELDEKIFDGDINYSLIHQAVVTYLANQRRGLASTKTRGEVRGSGRKPWRQKGTGRARVGSIRSPLWRGGGVVFGPKVRDYSKKFPQRMRNIALKSALNAKLKDNQIMIIQDINIDEPRTKKAVEILKNLKLNGERIRIVKEKIDKNLKLALRNLERVELEKADSLTTYTALDCKKLIITEESLRKIEERLRKWIK